MTEKRLFIGMMTRRGSCVALSASSSMPAVVAADLIFWAVTPGAVHVVGECLDGPSPRPRDERRWIIGHRDRRRIAHVREHGIQDRAEMLGEVGKDGFEMAIEVGEQEHRAVVEGDEATVVQRPHRIRRPRELGDQGRELVPNGCAIGTGLHGEREREMTLCRPVTLRAGLVDRDLETVGEVREMVAELLAELDEPFGSRRSGSRHGLLLLLIGRVIVGHLDLALGSSASWAFARSKTRPLITGSAPMRGPLPGTDLPRGTGPRPTPRLR